MEYTVIYVIQVDAESELEAAKTADKFMKAQTDPHCLVAAGSQLGGGRIFPRQRFRLLFFYRNSNSFFIFIG